MSSWGLATWTRGRPGCPNVTKKKKRLCVCRARALFVCGHDHVVCPSRCSLFLLLLCPSQRRRCSSAIWMPHYHRRIYHMRRCGIHWSTSSARFRPINLCCGQSVVWPRWAGNYPFVVVEGGWWGGDPSQGGLSHPEQTVRALGSIFSVLPVVKLEMKYKSRERREIKGLKKNQIKRWRRRRRRRLRRRRRRNWKEVSSGGRHECRRLEWPRECVYDLLWKTHTTMFDVPSSFLSVFLLLRHQRRPALSPLRVW